MTVLLPADRGDSSLTTMTTTSMTTTTATTTATEGAALRTRKEKEGFEPPDLRTQGAPHPHRLRGFPSYSSLVMISLIFASDVCPGPPDVAVTVLV